MSNPVVLAQADAVEYEALSSIGQCRQVDVFAAFWSAARLPTAELSEVVDVAHR
ncbi:hypothetical protein ACFYYI_32545 [Streptomyces sp. NPDC002387]|uniref:hypothetical protein n=1 Tax=unclassified Streptomyces TaxID=2593676 RepID=UPI00341EA851